MVVPATSGVAAELTGLLWHETMHAAGFLDEETCQVCHPPPPPPPPPWSVRLATWWWQVKPRMHLGPCCELDHLEEDE